MLVPHTQTLYNTTSITGAPADSFVKVSRGGEERGIVGLSPPIGRCTDSREERVELPRVAPSNLPLLQPVYQPAV
ncbi:hypothetical protein PBY51_001139 [Eleginops maclovinus]|uniref:Uncharacterized protein n=1 Tax=Eleginops maclovinus TaxID=56733 RepID=A0AAN8ALA6_ELEMC|nr:hypothetical protein PBY51_001139 [Eleginops maclovinus]